MILPVLFPKLLLMSTVKLTMSLGLTSILLTASPLAQTLAQQTRDTKSEDQSMTIAQMLNSEEFRINPDFLRNSETIVRSKPGI